MSMEVETRAVAGSQVLYSPAQAEAQPQEVSGEEAFVGNLLRYGVFIAIAVSALGSIMYFMVHGFGGNVGPLIRYSANPAFPHSPGGLVAGLGRLSPSAVVAMGLLLLVALRVFQVLLSGMIFAIKRNFKFTFISLFVFAVLMSSLFLGKAGG